MNLNYHIGVSVTRSLVLCVCFADRCLSFCTFSFGHCVVCSTSIYGYWLPPFGIFDLRILITPLVSLIYGFWLPPFGIFDLRILITSLWYLQTLLNHNERGRAQRPVTPVRSWAGLIRGVAHHSTGGNMTHYHIKWDIIIIYFSIIIANGEYTWYWFLWTFCNRKCDFWYSWICTIVLNGGITRKYYEMRKFSNFLNPLFCALKYVSQLTRNSKLMISWSIICLELFLLDIGRK